VSTSGARDALEAAYRTEARRVRATLIRLLGGNSCCPSGLRTFTPWGDASMVLLLS
jgi:hypothetical protein